MRLRKTGFKDGARLLKHFLPVVTHEVQQAPTVQAADGCLQPHTFSVVLVLSPQ